MARAQGAVRLASRPGGDGGQLQPTRSKRNRYLRTRICECGNGGRALVCKAGPLAPSDAGGCGCLWGDDCCTPGSERMQRAWRLLLAARRHAACAAACVCMRYMGDHALRSRKHAHQARAAMTGLAPSCANAPPHQCAMDRRSQRRGPLQGERQHTAASARAGSVASRTWRVR